MIVEILNHIFGFNNPSGAVGYFWSGPGADLGELAILGGLIQMYRKHTCHIQGCHRMGRMKVDGKEWIVCHKHHPTGPPTEQDLADHVRTLDNE